MALLADNVDDLVKRTPAPRTGVNLDRDKAQAILDYLMTRPCGEVISAVLWLQQALDQDTTTND